jgi:quinol monooxygenase YgiN
MKAKLFIVLIGVVIFMSSFGNRNSSLINLNSDNMTKAAIEENEMMITAKLSIKPEKIKDFLIVAKEMIEKSNKESGCKSYQLYQDPYNSTMFIFVEAYKNQAAIDAHFASDYFKAFGPKISGLVQEPAKIKIITVAKEVNQ